MKFLNLLAFALFLLSVTFSQTSGARSYTDAEHIKGCFASWGAHPFNQEKPDYRIVSGSVNVLGMGKGIVDDVKTEKPELILVTPSVSVMSQTEVKLMNPNGWYCIKGQVSVLGETTITKSCDAKMAMSAVGATVMGSNTVPEGGGVTVMGKLQTQCTH